MGLTQEELRYIQTGEFCKRAFQQERERLLALQQEKQKNEEQLLDRYFRTGEHPSLNNMRQEKQKRKYTFEFTTIQPSKSALQQERDR